MTCRTSLAAILESSALAHSKEDSAVLQVLDAFMDGWNSCDGAKYADTLFFPT